MFQLFEKIIGEACCWWGPRPIWKSWPIETKKLPLFTLRISGQLSAGLAPEFLPTRSSIMEEATTLSFLVAFSSPAMRLPLFYSQQLWHHGNMPKWNHRPLERPECHQAFWIWILFNKTSSLSITVGGWNGARLWRRSYQLKWDCASTACLCSRHDRISLCSHSSFQPCLCKHPCAKQVGWRNGNFFFYRLVSAPIPHSSFVYASIPWRKTSAATSQSKK